MLPSSRSTRAIFTVASSCNQNAETIGDARPGNVATFGRDLAQTEISDKTAQVQSESAHLSLDGEALYGSYRVKFDLQKGSLSKLASSRRKRLPAGDYSHARIALAVRRHRLRVILLGRSR